MSAIRRPEKLALLLSALCANSNVPQYNAVPVLPITSSKVHDGAAARVLRGMYQMTGQGNPNMSLYDNVHDCMLEIDPGLVEVHDRFWQGTSMHMSAYMSSCVSTHACRSKRM